jgi:regulator of ribosome biosynthesis
MYRHGYQKANNDAMEWPIMEVKGNDDPFADPWEKLRDGKRARVDKNLENRMRNQEKAGQLPKGTTTRVMKNLASGRKAGKEGGNKDRDSVLATGIPVDLQANKASAPIASKKRGKESTMAALIATQRSTASLGKFDKVREGEPERKKAQSKKRKFEGGTDKNVASTEAERGMKVLNAVMNGGGAAREKAKRNGSLARGETAYDYDFDDGLGASSFRKKKGRAGMGKLKKITKKRVK